jgi:fumarate reductase flavoprotein subunit
VGVKATGSTGETITVNAKAVVLTTGGFGANLDMVTEYKPELKGFMTTNAAGAQGQGIEMATAVGADTVDMDQIQIHPTVEANTAALSDLGSYSWLVVDQAMVDASSVIQGYIKKGYTVTGETYEELAKAMGVDEAAFAETMNTWNGYVEAKNDPDFGRTSFANKLDTAPYYAIKVTAGVHHTMGGLKINTNTEVLNENGEVIPGLFAAGEVTGGVHGANRLGGNAVADFTVFGRIAGAAASKYAA